VLASRSSIEPRAMILDMGKGVEAMLATTKQSPLEHYVSNPSVLWKETDALGRRAIAEAAFDRIEALGLDLVIHPSAEAERYGWSDAFGPDPLVCTISRSGRGERAGADTFQLSVRIVGGNVPSHVHRVLETV
jgi:hypothetical protein